MPWVFFWPHLSQNGCQSSRQLGNADGHKQKIVPRETRSLRPKGQKRDSTAGQEGSSRFYSSQTPREELCPLPPPTHPARPSGDFHTRQAMMRFPTPLLRWCQRRTNIRLGLSFLPGDNQAAPTEPAETLRSLDFPHPHLAVMRCTPSLQQWRQRRFGGEQEL